MSDQLQGIKKLISTLISVSLFLGCLTAVVIKGYQCTEKYLANPEGVSISYESIDSVPFPSFTFCPVHENMVENYEPKPFKREFFDQCNKNYYSYLLFGHPWIGEGDENCTDPKKFYESATNTIDDFNIGNIQILTVDSGDLKYFTRHSPELQWSKTPDMDAAGGLDYRRGFYSGQCYTLDFDEKLIKTGIAFISMVFGIDTRLWLNIHHKGSARNSAGFLLKSKTWYKKRIEFEYFKFLDYGGDKCESDPNYHFDFCQEEHILKTSLKEIGCSTPYGFNLDFVCTDKERPSKALKLLNDMRLTKNISKEECPHPCNFIQTKLETIMESGDGDGKMSDIYLEMEFDQFIKVTESYISYTELEFFAEIGGYLGLFLGISVFSLSQAFDFFLVHV